MRSKNLSSIYFSCKISLKCVSVVGDDFFITMVMKSFQLRLSVLYTCFTVILKYVIPVVIMKIAHVIFFYQLFSSVPQIVFIISCFRNSICVRATTGLAFAMKL